jgi:hypothetical protein
MRTFASQRPINCRQHMITELGLSGFSTLTLNVSHTQRGRIRINKLVIDGATPGVTNGLAYPWRGVYFRGVPVELQALPAPGYVFAGWSNRLDLGLQETINVSPSNNVTWTALFERSTPHDLGIGPYRFTSWDPAEPAGTAPPHMRFEQTSVPDPGLDVPLEGVWQLPYDRTNRSRINGLAGQGIAFLNTSSVQPDAGSGYLGSAVLALRTLGVTNIEVSWVAGTLVPNQQAYALRLQYAVGDAPFQDVAGLDGQPVEYLRNPMAGHTQLLGPVPLPSAANHQPYVSLRWKCYFVAGTSGPRAQLRLDDILVARADEFSSASGSLSGFSQRSPLQLRLELSGMPHRAYELEASTNLIDWTTRGWVTLDIDGHGELVEPWQAARPEVFYRLRR